MQISELPAHAATEQQGGIVVLLDRLERQIAEDHLISPQDDNADDTIQAIVVDAAERAGVRYQDGNLDMPRHLERRGT